MSPLPRKSARRSPDFATMKPPITTPTMETGSPNAFTIVAIWPSV